MTKPVRLAEAVDRSARMITGRWASPTIFSATSLSGGNVVPSQPRRPATSHSTR